MNRSLVSLAASLLFVLGVSKAQGQVNLTFDLSSQSGLPGQTLTYSGTLENVSGATVFLNGDAFDPLPVGFTLDDTDFFLNVPTFLPNGGKYIGPLFTLTLDPSLLPSASVNAPFSIIGGGDPGAQDTLGAATFSAHVGVAASTPEPGGLAILVGLSLGGGMLRRRIKYRRKQSN